MRKLALTDQRMDERSLGTVIEGTAVRVADDGSELVMTRGYDHLGQRATHFGFASCSSRRARYYQQFGFRK